MHPCAGASQIIHRHHRRQSLAFAGLHLGDLAFGHRQSPQYLNVVRTQAQHPFAHGGGQGERFLAGIGFDGL